MFLLILTGQAEELIYVLQIIFPCSFIGRSMLRYHDIIFQQKYGNLSTDQLKTVSSSDQQSNRSNTWMKMENNTQQTIVVAGDGFIK